MILRRGDRYVLREMTGVFLVSVFGLFLFLLLNFILESSSLSGAGIGGLLRLLVFRLPWILGLTLPGACVFAIFGGLGRLVHDREIIAFESIGISLRRILLPLFAFSLLVSGADFLLLNFGVPPAEQAYRRALFRIIYQHGEPHIRSDTFFKSPEGLIFYVQRYDRHDDSLHGVLVLDFYGQLFPLEEAVQTTITADKGRWEGTSWSLEDGHVSIINAEGLTVYTATFEHLEVPVDRIDSDIFASSRSPAEMSISELREKIATLRASGLSADALVVECHRKVAIPLAATVFVLLGGSLSLIFGGRSRAVGIVFSLLLVTIFYGLFIWTSTMGSRGMIYAPLAPWIPHLIFSGLGIWLFVRLDRLSSRDLWNRIRHMVPFVGLLLFCSAIVMGQETPVEIECRELFVSDDQRHVRAQGDVCVRYGETTLLAQAMVLEKKDENDWTVSASEHVSLVVGDDFALFGESLATQLVVENESVMTREASAARFSGESRFTNASGEEHFLFYKGEQGTIQFDDDGEVVLIEIRGGEFSTCDCAETPLRKQPYTVQMSRLLFYPDQLFVAFGLTVRSFGYSIFWLPVYVQPLEETLESPLFPAIGRSSLRGWFLKWNVPFYLDKEKYGAVLVDWFSRFCEIGLGAVFHYAFGGHHGKVRIYTFPARVGDSRFELSLDHALSLSTSNWQLGGRFAYNRIAERQDLTFSYALRGELEQWGVSLSAERSRREEGEETHIVERFPEAKISRASIPAGVFSLSPQASLGWFREYEFEDTTASLMESGMRFDGGMDVAVAPIAFAGFTLSPKAGVRLTRYEGSNGGQSQEVVSFSSGLSIPGLTLTYTFLDVVGRSPFYFDRLRSESQLTWHLFSQDRISVQLDGGYDLRAHIFDPLLLRVNWPGTKALSLVASYDLVAAVVEKVTLWGRWQVTDRTASCQFGYVPSMGQWEPLILQFAGSGETGAVSLYSAIDLMCGEVTQVEVDFELSLEKDWGIHFVGRYHRTAPQIFDPSFGIFHDLCDCLRIGVERNSGQIWFYASVLAFPDAVLRYTPESSEVGFGP
jgi:lipopolysaccharide export system permease protein